MLHQQEEVLPVEVAVVLDLEAIILVQEAHLHLAEVQLLLEVHLLIPELDHRAQAEVQDLRLHQVVVDHQEVLVLVQEVRVVVHLLEVEEEINNIYSLEKSQ